MPKCPNPGFYGAGKLGLSRKMCKIAGKGAKRRIRAAPPGERYFSVASEEPATRDVRTTHKSRGRKNASSVEENHRRDPASQKGRSRRTPAGITGSARGNAPTGFHGQSTGAS